MGNVCNEAVLYMKCVDPMVVTINARAEICILYPSSWNRAKKCCLMCNQSTIARDHGCVTWQMAGALCGCGVYFSREISQSTQHIATFTLEHAHWGRKAKCIVQGEKIPPHYNSLHVYLLFWLLSIENMAGSAFFFNLFYAKWCAVSVLTINKTLN